MQNVKIKINRFHENKSKSLFYSNEEVSFWSAIKRAEENIKKGEIYTQKEMDDYFREQFGIKI